MAYWQSVVLGIVQGLTEFLPVSSSGHLALGRFLLGADPPGITFEVVVHAGTLLAVVLVFYQDLAGMARALVLSCSGRDGRFWSNSYRRLATMVVVGSIPTVIVALWLEDVSRAFFVRPEMVGLFWIVTALVLFSSRPALRRAKADRVGLLAALVVGLAQGLAVMPGISRSGMTITTGLWAGLSRETAARFSFLLSVPVILGATILDLGQGIAQGTLAGMGGVYAAGFLAAAVSGYLAIRILLGLVARGRLHVFAYYCLAAGGTVVLWWAI